MDRQRNYQAEYHRRLQRGRARGLTRSQARGHAAAQEPSIKAEPVKSDQRLERALRELRRTNNQAIAAKEAGVAPERFRRFLREQKLAERKGWLWEITDKRPRDMTALTTRGAIDLELPDYETASLVGQHNTQRSRPSWDTNDISNLRPFEGLHGQGHVRSELRPRNTPQRHSPPRCERRNLRANLSHRSIGELTWTTRT